MSSLFKYLFDLVTHLVAAPPSPPSILAGSAGAADSLRPKSIACDRVSRGLVLTTDSLNLKGPIAGPQISLVPATTPIPTPTPIMIRKDHQQSDTSASSGSFNISLISDTSTTSSSSTSEEEDESNISLSCILAYGREPTQKHDRDPYSRPSIDLFSALARPPIGLGFSGLSRKDMPGTPFDGLGVVGIKRSSWRFGEEDEVEEEEGEGQLSRSFLREMMYTWMDDPFHVPSRVLTSIPEGEYESDDEGSASEEAYAGVNAERVTTSVHETSSTMSASESQPPPLLETITTRTDRVPQLAFPLSATLSSHSTANGMITSNVSVEAKPSITLCRDLSTATVSSGLKRSPSSSSQSRKSLHHPSPRTSSPSHLASPPMTRARSCSPLSSSSSSSSSSSAASPSPSSALDDTVASASRKHGRTTSVPRSTSLGSRGREISMSRNRTPSPMPIVNTEFLRRSRSVGSAIGGENKGAGYVRVWRG